MTLARWSAIAWLAVSMLGCATLDDMRGRFGRATDSESSDVADADAASSPFPSETPAPSAPAAQSPVYQSESLKPADSSGVGSGGAGWNVPEPSLSPAAEPSPSASQGPVPEAGIVRGGTFDSDRVGSGSDESFLPDLPATSGALAAPEFSGLPFKGSNDTAIPDSLKDPFAPVGVSSREDLVEPFPSLSRPDTPALPQYPSPAAPSVSGLTRGVMRGGSPAPVFTASTMNGGTFDLASHRGRVVVLDFWFSTCGPCLRSMPSLEQLRRQFTEDQLVIIGMNADQTRTAAERHIRQSPHPWDQVYTPATRPDLRKTFGVNLYPTFLVIDQVGTVQYRGNNVQQAVAKAGELVETPSLPQGSGTVAALR